MTVVFAILYLLVHVLILVVLGRFAVDMIQSFARGWRPQGLPWCWPRASTP